MHRVLISLPLVLLAPLVASAQDMPLFTFTKGPGGWVKTEGKAPEPRARFGGKATGAGFDFTKLLGTDYELTIPDPAKFRADAKPNVPSGWPASIAVVPDSGTAYIGFEKAGAVWAYQIDKDNNLVNGAPYAPLRVREGYDNDKKAREALKANPPHQAVTSLTLDTAGRIYAATAYGIQVFDPTGRPSGNLTLPAAGMPDHLGWEGEKKDTLVVWVGDVKWTRGMNATGK